MPASKLNTPMPSLRYSWVSSTLKNREYFDVIICIDHKSTISTQHIYKTSYQHYYRIFLCVTIFFTAALSFRLQKYLKKIFWIISRDETFPKYLKSFLSLEIIGAGRGLRRHAARGHVDTWAGSNNTPTPHPTLHVQTWFELHICTMQCAMCILFDYGDAMTLWTGFVLCLLIYWLPRRINECNILTISLNCFCSRYSSS